MQEKGLRRASIVRLRASAFGGAARLTATRRLVWRLVGGRGALVWWVRTSHSTLGLLDKAVGLHSLGVVACV